MTTEELCQELQKMPPHYEVVAGYGEWQYEHVIKVAIESTSKQVRIKTNFPKGNGRGN